jgi:lipopolysaccharide transport system permease protein
VTTIHPWVENAAPTRRWLPKYRFAELWHNRELVWFFAVRDIKVRYKQAVLGAAWAVIQPVVGAIAFTLIFNGLVGVDADGESYFVFALAGFIVWNYFSSTVSSGTRSILFNAELVTKVAFPKIVAPISTLVEGLVDLAIGVVVVIGAALVIGTTLSPVGIFLGVPFATILLIAAAAGPTLCFSASIVKYRDVGIVIGFGLQLFLFVTPVAYPPDLVPDSLRTVQYLNPLVGCLDLYRWAFAGSSTPEVGSLTISVASACVLLLVGWQYFRASEHKFADII